MQMTKLGHLAGYSDIGRTEVEPLPADPDFKTTGIWARAAAYPTLAPAEDRGSGAIRYRYWDAAKADDAWAFLAGERRVRRVSEVIMSSSPGLSTWDADHSGGFGAKPQEYNFKYLGDRNMLGCAHAQNSPASMLDRRRRDLMHRRLGDASSIRRRSDAAPGKNPGRAAVEDDRVR